MSVFFKNIFIKKRAPKITRKDDAESLIPERVTADLKLNKPAPDKIIASTETALQFTFPNDFINFYKQANGFYDHDTIGNKFSIWPLEKILEEYNAGNDKSFIPFCDQCIKVYRIGYLKDKRGIYNENDQVNPIARTFEEMVTLMIENPERI